MDEEHDLMSEMLDRLFGDMALSKFRNKIVLLLDEAQAVEGENKEDYVGVVMSFAAITLADDLVWHLEDHNGAECVTHGVTDMAAKFAQVVTHHVKTLAKEKGLEDPFATLSVNATLTKELLDELAGIEADKR